MNELSKAAAALGAIGGKSTSPAKQQASRENGRKHVAAKQRCAGCGRMAVFPEDLSSCQECADIHAAGASGAYLEPI